MDLSEYGAACRCLLRLRENEGEPATTDSAFIARFLPHYPEWQHRPGETDAYRVFELARELRLAERVEFFRDYERVLDEHRTGRGILVYTERVPEQIEAGLEARRYVTLLVDMTEDAFTLWCPFPSGQSDNLPKAARTWWDRWRAIGVVLYRADARQ